MGQSRIVGRVSRKTMTVIDDVVRESMRPLVRAAQRVKARPVERRYTYHLLDDAGVRVGEPIIQQGEEKPTMGDLTLEQRRRARECRLMKVEVRHPTKGWRRA